jgi:hypothetical protein
MRWWDGSAWTEQVQESTPTGSAQPAGSPPQPAADQARNPKAEAKAAKAYAKASRPWYKKKRWWVVGALVLLIGIIIAASAGGGGDDSDDTPTIAEDNEPATSSDSPSDSPSEDASESTEDAPEQWYDKVAFGDGSYQVGKDFPPGNYIIVSPAEDSFGCYWQISSDANGTNIVANDNSSGGFPYVALLKDRYFQSQGCGDWAEVPAKATPVYTDQVTDGEWVAGLTIRPGQYRAVEVPTDGGGCYWAVTKTGSNGGDIIANDNVPGGHPQVTVKAGQSFKSQGCGDWEKAG